MPPAGRLGDPSQVPSDAHGCPACPHGAIGPAIDGSPNVNVNGRSALRVGDHGVHAACCGPNTWEAVKGAPGVFINGKAAHRQGDATKHCGGSGKLVAGSGNVFIGDHHGGAPKPQNDEQFVLLTPDGKPIADMPYKITTADGAVYRGTTNDRGETERVYTDDPKKIKIEPDDQ